MRREALALGPTARLRTSFSALRLRKKNKISDFAILRRRGEVAASSGLAAAWPLAAAAGDNIEDLKFRQSRP
jgi:hypothetical protein